MDLGFGQQNQQMGNQALEAVGMIAEMQENMLDAEIHKLDNLDGKGFSQNNEKNESSSSRNGNWRRPSGRATATAT